VFYSAGILSLPYDMPLMFAGFLYMTWWSLAVAMIIGALSERTEIVEKIWMPISYVNILLSGFPYMAGWLPPGLRDMALTINPPLLAYEIIRGGLYGNLTQTYQYPMYLTYILAVLTLVGLRLMRDVRHYVDIV
jgi:capsular polysaccharide transport system permease protein